jgi:predicted MPP superfamily phosphohydrolase
MHGYAIIIALLMLGCTANSGSQTPATALRIVAFGDNEGVIARPGDDPLQKNPALPRLLEILRQEDEHTPIDLLLHTGDFVRFDATPQLFMQALGPFLRRFYPTSGGDEEFLQGKYWTFLRAVPHLHHTVLQRIAGDHNGFEPYYAVHYRGIHVISLHNPDNYGDPKRSPEFAGYDLFSPDHANRQQYRWLVAQLEEIRVRRRDQGLIIVLSHRPVYNQSRHLVALFDRYRVDLVLSGDFHVYGRARGQHTLYLVTGIAGDRAVGGCEKLNDPLADGFLGDYRPCFPELGTFRKDTFAYHYDHYIDLRLHGWTIQGKAVEVADGRVLDTFTHASRP